MPAVVVDVVVVDGEVVAVVVRVEPVADVVVHLRSRERKEETKKKHTKESEKSVKNRATCVSKPSNCMVKYKQATYFY